jgi:hypothetical protein
VVVIGRETARGGLAQHPDFRSEAHPTSFLLVSIHTNIVRLEETRDMSRNRLCQFDLPQNLSADAHASSKIWVRLSSPSAG